MGILGSLFKLFEVGPKIISNVVNGIVSVHQAVKDAGKNVVQGIWDGISGAAGWLADKVKSFASNIVKNIQDALDINSPSKVMAQKVR